MPSPTVQETELESELESLHQTKQNLDKLESVRADWKSDMDYLREMETGELSQYRQVLDELNQEKMAHVEELRMINNDINALDALVKQAEGDKTKVIGIARHKFNEAMRLRNETNLLRLASNAEPLPESLLHDPDLPKYIGLLDPTTGPAAGALGGGSLPAPPSLLHASQQHQQQQQHYMPLWSMAQSHAAAVAMQYGLQHAGEHGHREAAAVAKHEQQQKLEQLEASSEGGGGDREKYGECSVSQQPMMSLKQTPPPMKTCTSCQQLIHRNAPICPMCKSKSRSKNPKKPKRKQPED